MTGAARGVLGQDSLSVPCVPARRSNVVASSAIALPRGLASTATVATLTLGVVTPASAVTY
jgi:hypothetical protein